VPPKSWEWIKRIHFGRGRLVALDWGEELWVWDASKYETAVGIEAVLARAGRETDNGSICFHATASLLDDVVDAAGGVERSLDRLRAAMERVREFAALAIEAHGPISDGGGLTDSSTEDAWYSIEEMIVWARTLDERLRRGRYVPGYSDQGLIPALATGPRRDAIMAARSTLLNTEFGEALRLANLNLHLQSTQAGSKGARMRNGEVLLDFPDRVEQKVLHRWELTYEDGRDGETFAENLFAGVERFMDEMFTALERDLPERFRS